MKKGYYIHFDGRISIGVSKKIDMQIEEFSKCFEMHEIEVETLSRTFFQRVMGLLPWKSIDRNYEVALEKMDNPDFIYVRRAVAEKSYLDFFKKIREKFPQCKIIIEIFTYPYDKDDFGKWNAWPFYFKELLYRNKLGKYIDRFVTYTDDDEIFGVKTIKTTNGINVDNIKMVQGAYSDDTISLIAVAYMQRHHGYERLIEGLFEYYQKDNVNKKIVLRLVGEGPEKKYYQKLVNKFGLEKYIKFYPTTTGERLDELYNSSDIALASFGMYRLGIYGKIGVLKSRECLAKGMPMLSGNEIDIVEEGYPYVKIFKNDSSKINMDDVVSFYENFRMTGMSKGEIAQTIRTYAFATVSMEKVMKPIIEYINDYNV